MFLVTRRSLDTARNICEIDIFGNVYEILSGYLTPITKLVLEYYYYIIGVLNRCIVQFCHIKNSY